VSDGRQIAGTRQITGGKDLPAVKKVLREALEDLGEDVPEVLK
jgi:hypothetical protein